MATNIKKTVKTIKKVSKKIKNNNDLFEKMSAEEKRVAIAKEVLSLINKQKLKPQHMQWVLAKNICSIKNVEQQKQLSDVIKEIPSCAVCAIGGLFVGAVSKFNNLTCDQVKVGSKTSGLFKDINAFKESTMTATTGTRINRESEIAWNGIKPFLKKFFSLKQLALIEYTFEGGRGNTDSFSLQEDFGISDNLRHKCLDFSQPYNSCNSRTTSKLMIAIMKNIIENNGTFIP